MAILDTAGQDDFEALRPGWMSQRDGYVFVYDITSRASLTKLEPYYELHKILNLDDGREVPIMLVANKKDLVKDDPSKQAVRSEEGRRYAEGWGANYIETSAVTGEGVTEIFESLVRMARTPEPVKSSGKKWCVTGREGERERERERRREKEREGEGGREGEARTVGMRLGVQGCGRASQARGRSSVFCLPACLPACLPVGPPWPLPPEAIPSLPAE